MVAMFMTYYHSTCTTSFKVPNILIFSQMAASLNQKLVAILCFEKIAVAITRTAYDA